MHETGLALDDIIECLEGRVPPVVSTASADGLPNITYLTSVFRVDAERIALSNQFMSKTARNLRENPLASLLILHPVDYSEYRLDICYERTERRGPIFERLRAEVDQVAALTGMSSVFRLRSADIFRVLAIERVYAGPGAQIANPAPMSAVASLITRMSRAVDLDQLVEVTVRGLDELLGYRHSSVLLVDERGTHLFTIASHGYPDEGVGSEQAIGDGVAGLAALRCEPVRDGHLRYLDKYARAVRTSFETSGEIGPGREIPMPGLPDTASSLAVPAMAAGEVVGVVITESPTPMAFTADDEAVLTIVASLVAERVQLDRTTEDPDVADPPPTVRPVSLGDPQLTVRYFPVDGSVFLGIDYLIRGVAGRILWSLLQRHDADGRTEFTNKEIRLDQSLELPTFRDNLDSRLILLKRRLDERNAPIRIERTGRGRLRLHVEAPLRLVLEG